MITQENIISDKFESTALNLVNEYESVGQIEYMSLTELAEFLNINGKWHFVDPESLAKVIQKAARSSYHLPKATQDSVNQVLGM